MSTDNKTAEKSISDMTFNEYDAYLKTLPFFERMATMKVYNPIMLDKVINESLELIRSSLNESSALFKLLYND